MGTTVDAGPESVCYTVFSPGLSTASRENQLRPIRQERNTTG